MSFTYTTLTQAIKDYANTNETTFNNNIDNFITSAEDRILRSCQLPNFRKNVEGQMSAGTQYLATPSDFLAPFSLSVTDSNKQSFLLLKEVAFLREAYPNASVEGTEVAGGQTWLGTNAPECLLYGSMVQANLFLKGEADMQQLYEGQYQEALVRLRNESAGKSMQDSYRYGQPRQAVE
jgi:hypothetical protein